jgi:hypothetical protein
MSRRPKSNNGTAARQKVKEIAAKLNKGEGTIWRWISEGLDITSEESVRQFFEGKKTQTNELPEGRERVERAFETAEAVLNRKAAGGNGGPPAARIELIGDSDLPPPRRRGAAAALERLEATEKRAHARLLTAIKKGNPSQIEALQDFWLRCS